MRKLNVLQVFMLVFCVAMTIVSCSKDDLKTQNNTKQVTAAFKKSTEESNLRIQNWYNQKVKLKVNSRQGTEFDFENVLSYNSDNHETLIVNQLNLNSSNIINYALTFSKDFEKIEESMIIKTINLDDNFKKAEYYDFNNNLLFSINFDLRNELASFEINTLNDENQKLDHYICSNSVGENVVLCMEDVYSNHGWVSVWAIVQTGFLPQTGAVLAAACLGDVLDNGDSCYEPIP